MRVRAVVTWLCGDGQTYTDTRACVLLVPRTPLKSGEQAFGVAVPTAWNSLPTDIQSLQKET